MLPPPKTEIYPRRLCTTSISDACSSHGLHSLDEHLQLLPAKVLRCRSRVMVNVARESTVAIYTMSSPSCQ